MEKEILAGSGARRNLASHITYPTVVMFRSILMNNSCEIEVFRFVLLMKKVQLGISFKNFAGFGKSLQFN